MVKKFEEPVGNRVDQIYKEAEERLNYFYSSYGEWSGRGTCPHRKSKEKALSKEDRIIKKGPFFDGGLIPKRKVINRPARLSESNLAAPRQIEIQEPKESLDISFPAIYKIPSLNSKEEIDYENLSSRQIIDKIRDLTGETITISTKSKKSIVKYAKTLLEKKRSGLTEESIGIVPSVFTIDPIEEIAPSVIITDSTMIESNEKVPEITVTNPTVVEPKKVNPRVTITETMLKELNEVSFEGLSSRQIIDKVKIMTGEVITICVKSKANVIKHATNILKDLGFTVK